MTWQLWGLVAAIAAAFWGLGCLSARAGAIRRSQRATAAGAAAVETPKHNHTGLISDRRANAILAVFFTAVALAVAVDTIYLQVKVNRYMHGQVDCNTALIDAEVAISEKRQEVDELAVEYDVAMDDYLHLSAEVPVIPKDAPAYLAARTRLDALAAGRAEMLKVYAQHPFPKC